MRRARVFGTSVANSRRKLGFEHRVESIGITHIVIVPLKLRCYWVPPIERNRKLRHENGLVLLLE